MAQGRRPDPFRTRKLRPGTAMVLHPEGCGRVARRRTQTSQGGDTTACPLPFSHTRGTTASDHPHPNKHDGVCRDKPMAHPVREPARTQPHTRQARHIGTKGIALGDPFLRVCGGIHNQTQGAGQRRDRPAFAGPRMTGHTRRPATGISGLPGACFRHMAHVPANAFEISPARTASSVASPAAGKDTGYTSDATTRLRPQHQRES